MDDSEDPAMILDFLFLGSKWSAVDREALDRKNIKFIVNAASELPNYHETTGLSYLRLNLEDECDQALNEAFELAFIAVEGARVARQRVLVHCQAGISRSASFILYYLIRTQGMTLKEAYDHTKQRRSCIGPNEGFLRWLIEQEKKWRGVSEATMSMLDYYAINLADMGFDSEDIEMVLRKSKGSYEEALRLLLTPRF